MHPRKTYWIFFLALVFPLTSCKKKKPATPFQIYFTADVNGRLEPCGCFTGQYGGLTRIDTWLKHHDPEGLSLRLDVGDAIKGTADYDVIHYQHLVQAFQELQYEALNIGAREASLSVSTFEKLAADTGAPLVSANLVDATSGELVCLPYRIINSREKNIAVIGLLDPDSVKNTLGDGLEVQSMETTLTNLLPQLEKSHHPDLTILLAFTNEEKMRALARQFYELDVILGGDVAMPSQELIIENESLILFTTNQARAVGDLKFTLESDRAENPEFDIHLMEDSIPQSSNILALSKSYRELIRHTKLDIDNPETVDTESVIPGTGTAHHYVGSQTCSTCHATAMAQWAQSGHAHAFESLVRGGSDADPNCISCHTVGFGEVSGYQRSFGKEKLTDVGCESCHGPGSEHIRQRTLGDPEKVTFHFRPLGASQCTKCHHGEFSRPFTWEEFWPAVEHGKEAEEKRP